MKQSTANKPEERPLTTSFIEAFRQECYEEERQKRMQTKEEVPEHKHTTLKNFMIRLEPSGLLIIREMGVTEPVLFNIHDDLDVTYETLKYYGNFMIDEVRRLLQISIEDTERKLKLWEEGKYRWP